MVKKKILVWETLSTVSGGQKMTLMVLDMLREQCDFLCLIPGEGMLSEELNKRGIPYILMGDQTLPTGVKGKSVIFRYGWMSVKNIFKSLGQIRKFKPDILYAPGPAALPWSAVCGALTGKPVIWHLHHIFLDGATKKLLNICGRCKSVRKIVAVSRCVGEQITSEKAHSKVEVLYNPVDFEKYSGGSAENVIGELAAQLGRDLQNTVVIGHVALIQRSKRQGFVIDLIAKLRQMGYDAVGLFAGECREPDYLEELKQQVETLEMEEEILFFGRRSDIPDVLQAINVLMIPSAFEGFPLAGLEAAAAGVPVAACDVAGAAEFIAVSGDGKTFTENDIDSAVDAVKDILAEKAAMSARGKDFAARMSIQNYKGQICNLFGGTF